MKAKKKRKLPRGWMGKASLRWLYARAQESNRVVEVGCWLGRSTTVLAKGCPGTVWAVDHWLGTPDEPDQHGRLYAGFLESRDPYKEFRRNLRPYIKAGKVIPMRMASVEAARKLRLQLSHQSMDMVFIDGDHSYPGVFADLEAWTPMVASGGLLCGHDFHYPGVQQAVTERFAEVKLGPGTIWSVRV